MRLDYDARLRLRRFSGVLGPLVLLPTAVWFYTATPSSPLAGADPTRVASADGSSPPAGSAPSSGAAGSDGAAPTGGSAPSDGSSPSDGSAASDGGSSDGSAPTDGYPPSDGQARVVVRVDARPDGSFEVVETVRLPDPAGSLRLQPRSLAPAGAPFDAAEPVHSEVEVRVRGERVVRVPDVGTGVTVVLPAPTEAVEVRYRLDGATVRTVPGPAGRALGAVAPLTDAQGLLASFAVEGDPVLAVTCPTLPEDRQLCGSDEAGTLVVDPLPVATALLLAQLDLDA